MTSRVHDSEFENRSAVLLIVVGVVGGLMAFGVIGIHVGPVVLAVAYTLLDEWVAEGDRVAAGTAGAPAEGAIVGSGATKTNTEPAR